MYKQMKLYINVHHLCTIIYKSFRDEKTLNYIYIIIFLTQFTIYRAPTKVNPHHFFLTAPNGCNYSQKLISRYGKLAMCY